MSEVNFEMPIMSIPLIQSSLYIVQTTKLNTVNSVEFIWYLKKFREDIFVNDNNSNTSNTKCQFMMMISNGELKLK